MAKEYTTADIKIKDDIEHIRLRTKRTLGTYVHTTAIREIVDNAMDEVTRGYGTSVELIYHPDESIEIIDDGRGLPIDWDSEAEMNGIMKCLGTSKAGANFDDTENTRGTNGEGGVATNAISSRFDVTVYRDGKKYVQQFKQGRPGHFTDTSGYNVDSSFKQDEKSKKLVGVPTTSTDPSRGTSIRFTFDPVIVPEDEADKQEVAFRLLTSARLSDGMKVSVTWEDGTVDEFHGPEYGAKTVLPLMDDKAIPLLDIQGHTSYQVPDPRSLSQKDGGKTFDKISRDLDFDLAVVPSQNPTIATFVNGIYTPENGSHLNATLKAIGSALMTKKARGLDLKNGEQYPTEDDFSDTASLVLSIRTPAPPFIGQDKRKLTSVALGNALEREVSRALMVWVSSPANNESLKTWAHEALVKARTKRKIESARAEARAATSSRNNTGNVALPEALVPSEVTGRGSGAEIHFCEGLSALGTVTKARYSKFQAGYPLQGKVIKSYNVPLGSPVPADKLKNPRKEREVKTMRHDEAFVAIERILGCGARENCDPEKCRYDRIFFTTDADPDGANITAQLLSIFYYNFRPLIEAGMVFSTQPPLFIVSSTSDANMRIYCIDEEERDEVVSDLQSQGVKGIEVQRCKGLGETDAVDFRKTVMNPLTRKVTRFDIDKETDDVMAVVFGPSAEERRKFIRTRSEENETSIEDLED